MGDEGMLGVVQAQQVQVSNDGGLNYIPIEAATITDLIHPIDVMGDEGMLGVVQAQQVQISNDGGLNDISIEVATMTVRALSIACRCMGHTLFCLL